MTAQDVAGAGPGLQGEAPKVDGLSIRYVQVHLGPAEEGDGRLAASEWGPEQPRVCDVVGVAVVFTAYYSSCSPGSLTSLVSRGLASRSRWIRVVSQDSLSPSRYMQIQP